MSGIDLRMAGRRVSKEVSQLGRTQRVAIAIALVAIALGLIAWVLIRMEGGGGRSPRSGPASTIPARGAPV